ncbi:MULTISPECIES: DUF2834 domain-containing protein [Hyphomonas]|uniref:DUF2834 domain-containing protein n=1 Tax=Hyphomonas adhaerens TaxID=81029 RepID=A0A3B9GTM5_9PROT|nr:MULTISPECIES: DUF2834 domain-containing protein [Hyphomonas]MBB41150.1 hypothetical protein [Hyphomonas sp.]HAE25773.1 hypothetical protein [Hyphomonas adhaerens]|tara:strand:- start:754 stop:1095 length:342 start_codon:yes stop_codon:yes gene_type:complete
MSKTIFEASVLLVGAAFTIAFGVIVVPALIESGDIAGAFAAGFVNPFASGYSLDTILCAVILVVWVLHERSALGIRHGWVAIPLSIIPGVAPAFAVYLVIRSRQLSARGGDCC